MSDVVKRVCGELTVFGRVYVLAADHDRIVSALTDAGVKMQAERDRLTEQCRELEEDLIITEEERDSSRMNASAFENAMGEAQHEAGRLRDERDTMRAEVEQFKAANAELSEINAARRRHLDNAKKAAGIGPTDDLVGAIELLRKDAERLEWLMCKLPGSVMRAIGVFNARGNGDRATIDAAMEASR